MSDQFSGTRVKERALYNSFFSHSGPGSMSGMTDPESRNYLKTLDSCFRRNDRNIEPRDF
jgi:hypothetical protein